MAFSKVTLLMQATTRNSAGDAQRLAGFSESYYNILAADSGALKTDIVNLATARAALFPANTSIVGYRIQAVDPTGASIQSDTPFPPSTTVQNDLPSVAFQWTVRSSNSPNQRSLILRGIPDIRVVTGEYSPQNAYNAAMIAFFNQLRVGNWRFKAINRTILPVKIVEIVGSLMTTVGAHGLVANDLVNIMSTKVRPEGVVRSYQAGVIAPITATTATLFLAGRGENVPNSDFGRVRKADTILCPFSITDDEIIHPTAITRKVGRPFRSFRGRRTARR